MNEPIGKRRQEKNRALNDERRVVHREAIVYPNGDKHALTYRCGRCRKPTIYTGPCYECGTGRSRTYAAQMVD